MNYWLMKSEPLSYSIDHLEQYPNQTDHWDGVRNYQARNMMRDDMRCGDLIFFYHSNCKVPGIVGVMSVVKEAYPDFTALDPEDHHFDPKSTPENPRWCMVDIQFKRKFKRIVSLERIKSQPALKDMAVARKGNRLSITPVRKEEWDVILGME